MGSKAIHQLQLATQREIGDLLYFARPSGSSYLDRKITLDNIFPLFYNHTTTLTSSEVITLGTATEIVPSQGTDVTIVPWYWIVDFTDVTIAYATHTSLSFGAQAMTGTNDIGIVGINQAADVRLFARPKASSNGGYMVQGEGMYARTLAGNPTAGDGTITITTFFTII